MESSAAVTSGGRCYISVLSLAQSTLLASPSACSSSPSSGFPHQCYIHVAYWLLGWHLVCGFCFWEWFLVWFFSPRSTASSWVESQEPSTTTSMGPFIFTGSFILLLLLLFVPPNRYLFRACLVSNFFYVIFVTSNLATHVWSTKCRQKKKTIVQLDEKSWDKTFKPN